MRARLRTSPPSVVDSVLAGLLVAYAQIDTWLRPGVVPGPRGVAAVGLTVMSLALAWRRTAPLAAASVSMAALAAASVIAGGAPEGGVILVPVLVVLYSVAAHERIRRAAAGAAVTLVAVVVQSIQDPKLAGVGNVVLVDAFFLGILGGAAWTAGRYVRHRRHDAAALEQRARRLEQDRADQDAIVAEERARIARELHDVVAHTVSVMGVQAAAASSVLDTTPERAREPLASIEATARVAVSELRRMLGVLRDDSAPDGLAPQPRLDAVQALIEQLRPAGTEADLIVEGAVRVLPPGIELAAYRIVQESLTNVRKHAAARRVTVRLTYRADALQITIEDDGPGGRAAIGSGHGLVGMRERVQLYGGKFEAGPRDGHGFAVHAEIPLSAAV